MFALSKQSTWFAVAAMTVLPRVVMKVTITMQIVFMFFTTDLERVSRERRRELRRVYDLFNNTYHAKNTITCKSMLELFVTRCREKARCAVTNNNVEIFLDFWHANTRHGSALPT